MKLTDKQFKYSAYSVAAIVSISGGVLAWQEMKRLQKPDYPRDKSWYYGCIMTGVGLAMVTGGISFMFTISE